MDDTAKQNAEKALGALGKDKIAALKKQMDGMDANELKALLEKPDKTKIEQQLRRFGLGALAKDGTLDAALSALQKNPKLAEQVKAKLEKK
jgi:hypothetical protein